LGRISASLFAGDRRVWSAAGVMALPLVALIAYYCLRPVDYYTGTNSVELYTYVAETPPGVPMCVRGLEIPAGTGRVRLDLISRTNLRPALKLVMTIGAAHAVESTLPAAMLPRRASHATFTIPELPARPAERAAALCVSASDLVNWGGTPLLVVPARPPTVAGHPLTARVAVWYLPPVGSRHSYVSGLGMILSRASLFRAGAIGPGLLFMSLIVVLPALALAAVRCLALAGRMNPRRMGVSLFAIAALNFSCWGLLTPLFQSPDEVDHFAYAQSLIERGKAPSRDPGSPLARWSSAENLALEDMSFFTDHQVGNTRPPWSRAQQSSYYLDVARLHPAAPNGGGNETAATHGPIYYAALGPAYLLASNSPFSQLTMMRLTSALIGALTVLCTFLLARELAPGHPWLAVLAALLVAFQPMYGFMSGSVNNDVGVNAAAAALLLLLIRMLRRGLTVQRGLLIGAVLLILPIIKGTGYALFPVAGVAFAATAWRHHRREALSGWAALVAGAVVGRGLAVLLNGAFRQPAAKVSATGSASAAANSVLEHPFGYLGYVWQVFLPRLSFMAPHWETTNYPGFVIFVERGWGAFGWYDVFFSHWVYSVIFVCMLAMLPIGLIAARRERLAVRRNLAEVGILLLTPIAVIAGVEAAFYTVGTRPVIPEFGRYVFPAIAALAFLVAASMFAFGRRYALPAGAALLTAMIGLSYAGQLTTLAGSYA
jgi:hypothetical protein